jgi:peptidoglycan/xylan/chitin deacetylase (PgdA/CDA1 family)
MRYPRTWSLPDGHKMVMLIGLAFESFEKRSQVSIFPPGQLDSFSLSYGDYGWKAGIWRLYDLLNELQIAATMSTNGQAAERHPEAVQAGAKMGIEISGHGWANDVRQLEPEAELDEIRRCTQMLTQVAGERPVGWICQGFSGTKNTNRLLAQEGYIWNSDDASDDIPFITKTEAGELVVLPREGIPMNDLSMWARATTSPQVIWENFKDTFDTLYAEAASGRPRILDLTLHAHMAGRPTLIPNTRRMIQYAQAHEGIWFARRKDLAAWVNSCPREDFVVD